MYEHMAAALEDDAVSLVAVGMVITETTGQSRMISAPEKIYLTKEEAMMNLFEEGDSGVFDTAGLQKALWFSKGAGGADSLYAPV